MGLFLAVDFLFVFIVEHLATVEDVDGNARPVGHIGGDFGDLSDRVHTFDNLAKNDMFAIEVLALLQCDKELR